MAGSQAVIAHDEAGQAVFVSVSHLLHETLLGVSSILFLAES
jgi:hypothetical protein